MRVLSCGVYNRRRAVRVRNLNVMLESWQCMHVGDA